MRTLLGGLRRPVDRPTQALRLAVFVAATILLGALGFPLLVAAFALLFAPLALFGADLGFTTGELFAFVRTMTRGLLTDLLRPERGLVLVPTLVLAGAATYRASRTHPTRWTYAAGPALVYVAFAAAGIVPALQAAADGRSDALDEVFLTPFYHLLGISLGGVACVRVGRRDERASRPKKTALAIPARREPAL